MVRTQDRDQILFQQVISFSGLLFIAFVESALGLIPAFYGAAPKLVFGFLFVIGVRFPSAVPLFPIMIIGGIYDLLQANPLGYSSSLYLIILIYTQIRRNLLLEADATSIWSEFVLMVAGMMIYMMIIFVFYTGAWPPLSDMLFQAGLTILIFPIINWLFVLAKNLTTYFGLSR